jgi:hypothetical protein
MPSVPPVVRTGADGESSLVEVLTRGYWDEADAQAQAERMNRSTPEDTQYFVRVSDEGYFAKPS